MHSAVQALPSPATHATPLTESRDASDPAARIAPAAETRAARVPALNFQGPPTRRLLLATLVAGLHLGGLAVLAHLGMKQISAPEIVPIQVALIEAEPVARPTPQPPAPEPTPPQPASEPAPAPPLPRPEPPPPEVRRPEPPPPPKPVPRKPAPKPVAKQPTPVTESPTALSAAAEAAPEPAPAPAPAPVPAPTPAPAPAAAAPAAVTAARFDAAYLNNPRPAYPMLSRRLREEGQVMLRVLVSPEGQPARIELRTSSGSERLDRAAQDAVARWRFVPARRGDLAVEAWVLVPIVFKLQGN